MTDKQAQKVNELELQIKQTIENNLSGLSLDQKDQLLTF